MDHGTNQLDWIDRASWPGPYAEPDYTSYKDYTGIFWHELDKSSFQDVYLDTNYTAYFPGDPLILDGELVGWVISLEWRHKLPVGHNLCITYQPYIRSTSET